MPPRPKKSKAPPKRVYVIVQGSTALAVYNTEDDAHEGSVEGEVVYRYELWKGKD